MTLLRLARASLDVVVYSLLINHVGKRGSNTQESVHAAKVGRSVTPTRADRQTGGQATGSLQAGRQTGRQTGRQAGRGEERPTPRLSSSLLMHACSSPD